MVFLMNARTITILLSSLLATQTARDIPALPLIRISQSGPLKCLTCGAPTRSRPTVEINSQIRVRRARISAGNA